MSLKSGDYYLYAYNLDDRPIGAQNPSVLPTPVVVQPGGTEAQKWYLQDVGSKYTISFGGGMSRNANGAVDLFPPIPIPPYLWEIVPQNSDIAEELYGIFVLGSGEGWFIDKDSPLVEPPVKIFHSASSIRIVPVPVD